MNRASAPGAPSIDRLHELLQSRSIMACNLIFKLARLESPSAYQHTRSITAFKCISNLAQSQPRTVSPNLLDYGLQVHLQSRLITLSECISKFTQSQPPSVCANSLDRSHQVHISKLTRLGTPSASLSALGCHFQAHLELLSSTACSQSRYTVCRWVAI